MSVSKTTLPPANARWSPSKQRLQLNATTRAALLNGNCPKIELSGLAPCPVAVGHVHRLSSLRWIEITSIKHAPRKIMKGKRGKLVAAGNHELDYTLHDDRDPIRKLRHAPSAPRSYASDPDRIGPGHRGPNEEEIEQASFDSSYTAGPTSLSDAGEGIDLTKLHPRWATGAAERKAAAETEDESRKRSRRIKATLDAQRARARRLGVDDSEEMRAVDAALAKLAAKNDEKETA